MATARYPAFNQLMRSSQRRALPAWQAMIARAVDRGEVSPELHAGAVLNMIVSPLVTISIFEERRVTAREIGMFAELVRRATLAGAGEGGPVTRGQSKRPSHSSARRVAERGPATAKRPATTNATGKGRRHRSS
jgi:hypothetical protein